MNTYSLKTIEESIISSESGYSTTSYYLPVDSQGISVEYLTKFRIIKNNQMIIFDTEQEYRDWLSQNA